jgi:thymidylate kinase
MKKNQIVFFCGVDMCGKTQMAKALSQQMNLPYYKASTEKNGFVEDQSRFINDIRYSCPARLDLLTQIGTGIIYDRGYPCEWVYSHFFNRPTDLDAIWMLDEKYAALDAVIIIPFRTSYTGITDDLDPTIEKKLTELQKLYDKFATKCKVSKLCVDDENLERELFDITNFIGSI